ncbi:MAG: GIY-YIG nuclease family protein [Chitinophagaceae bacterium]|nr:GIY-YIG nuclease family protein [Chitinophagaceae bacterium]MBL0335737.1 GIY-YIG nuclease family protein [Chitinophagaceae bacterium]
MRHKGIKKKFSGFHPTPFAIGHSIDPVTDELKKILAKKYIYFIYILECFDGCFYTGFTNNILRRFKQHQEGFYPDSFTASNRPLTFKYFEVYDCVWDAIWREKQIKSWTRKKKEALIKGEIGELKKLARRRGRGKPGQTSA